MFTYFKTKFAKPSFMRIGRRRSTGFAAFMALLVSVSTAAPAQRPANVAPSLSYIESPLAFEPVANVNGTGDLYLASGAGYRVALRSDGARISMPQTALAEPKSEFSLRLIGSNLKADITAASPQAGVSNYIPTADSLKWRLGVRRWERVDYADVYPGIDLAFYGNRRFLEYDFRVAPNADLGKIQMAIDGAESVRLDKSGDLAVTVHGTEVRLRKPVAYQLGTRGRRIAVSSEFRLAEGAGTSQRVSFAVGPHDVTRELIVDPVLTYGLQPAAVDATVSGVAADGAGNMFVTGQNLTRGFYVSKYNSAGTLVFNTVVAGGSTVTCNPTGIVVDAAGKIYVVGSATSGLPTTSGAFQKTSLSKPNVVVPFVAVFPATGAAPTYLSYLGGSDSNDYSAGIAVNNTGEFFITGYESSTDFPTTSGTYLRTFPGTTAGSLNSAFVAEFNPSKAGAASLVYSTLLSASGVSSFGTAIAVDGSGNTYVSIDAFAGYPVTSGALTYTGGYSNSGYGAYVTKLNATGSALQYSAYLGPGDANAIQVDGSGDAYVAGIVAANDFPTTPGAYQTSYPGGFVAELNPAGASLVYSTYISGPSGALSPSSNNVFPQSIAITPGCTKTCSAYVAGYTSATDFPAINALQAALPAAVSTSGFLVEISGSGSSALVSSYLGGQVSSISPPFYTPLYPTPAVTVDGAGNVYFIANTNGTDFPVTLPRGNVIPASFMAKISAAAGGQVVPYPQAVNFDNFNPSQAIGVSSTVTGVPVPLVLRNLGSSAVTISSITFSSSEFSQSNTCSSTIPAGGSCTLNLAFLPSAAGVRTAMLSVESNAIKSPVNIALSGTGVAEGYLQLSAPTLNFPDVAVGASSAQQNFTVTNIGKSLVNLSIAPLSIVRSSTGNGSDFQQLSNCPPQLLAGASCSIGETFTPLATGLRSAQTYLSSDGFGNQSLVVNGTGILGASQGSESLSATALNFNPQLLSTSSPRQSVTLTNTGAAPITIYGVTIATTGQIGSSDFSIANGSCSNAAAIQIAPQSSCSVSVQFTPTSTATETGTLVFNDSSTGSPHSVALSGMGVAATQSLEFAPENFVFPDTPVGTTFPQSQTIYVYNTGTSPVTVGRLLITGDFSIVSSNCPTNVLKPNPVTGYAPSPSCSVRIAFMPSKVGSRTGTLSFVDSAGGTQKLTLAGAGITATGALSLQPNSMLFPAQAVGTTSNTQHFIIDNPGNTPVTVSDIKTTGDYSIVNACSGGFYPYVLPAWRTCGIDVSFTPTKTSTSDTGSVVVSSSAGTSTLSISGTGVAATIAVGLTPTAIAFGSVAVGTSSPGYSVYLRNTGTEAVTLNTAAISGTGAADFSFSGGNCGFFGNTLAPGVSCSAQVSFTPSAAASRSATLSLNDSSGTHTVALTATGVSKLSTVIASPVGIAFDEVPVGQSAQTNQSAGVRNFSASPVTISSAKITSGGSAFMIVAGSDGCSGTTLTVGGGCGVQIGFSPTAAGYQTGTLTFSDSASKHYVVSLAGYAPSVAAASLLNPTALTFPGQVLTTVSSTQTATLNNLSNIALTVGTLSGTNTVVGTSNTGAFTTSGSSGGSDNCSGQLIAPRSKCQVYIAFAPSVVGAATGSITFPVTYANNTTASFKLSLSGTGLAIKDSMELSPAGLSFPDQAVGAVAGNGADAPQSVLLYNAGNLPATIGALTGSDTVVGTSTKGDFSTSPTVYGSDSCSNQTISPYTSCSVSVAFTPGSVGAKQGALKFPVTYGDKKTATLSATLAGKGVASSSKVQVSPSSGQFDVQVVGTTSDSSQTLTFNFAVVGNLPVKVSTATITSNFSFVSDNCSGNTVAVNSSCQIAVAFSPTKTGAITGTLTIPNSAAGSPQKIALSGTGIATTQQIVLSQTSIAFGEQVIGTKSAVINVLVSNQSGSSVAVTSLSLSGTNAADFIESDSCSGSSIPAHGSCAIAVQFSPATSASLGARTAKITEHDSAAGSPRTITLTGAGIKAAPGVGLYPGSLNFGDQVLNTKSAPLTFSVTNIGSSALTISKVASSNGAEFPLSNNKCTGQTLDAGSYCLVSVSFAPNAGSAQTASITITDNASGSPHSLVVTGKSVGVPQAKLSPTSLSFATAQGVGTTSAPKVITLSNSGTDTLVFASIAVSGVNSGDFKQTNTCGPSIVAGATCTISVTFGPQATGSRSANLVITDNAGNVAGSVQTAALSGTAVGIAEIAFSPASLSWNTPVNVGSTSSTKTVSVTNPGSAALSLSAIAVVPTGDFTQTNTCGSQLAVGSSCVISVKFSPSIGGTRTAVISVSDSASGSPQTVALSGTGVGLAKASLSASAIDFGDQPVGAVSTAHSVTLTNTGTGSLAVASLKISGPNAGDFAATSTGCPGTVAPAANCVINVTFKPAVAGTRSATLTITDNSSNTTGSTQSVALGGNGAGTPQATLSATKLTYASTAVGHTAGPASVNLTNGGNGPLQIASISITGADANDFLEFDTCAPSVAAKATCEIAVYFIPSSTGTRTANVVIKDNSNGDANATQTIALTGAATGAPQVNLSATALSFGSEKVGSESAGQFVTLTNTGNAPLTVSSVTVTGADPSDYSIFNTCSTVSEESNCVVVVFFKPTKTGSRPASVTFTDNANNVAGTKQGVTLSGSGN